MKYGPGDAFLSILLFVVAAGCEVGGVWLIWKWRREGWRWPYFILGAILLVLFGIVVALQKQGFGRTLAALGGFSIGVSALWNWSTNTSETDRWDVVGGVIAWAGACIIMFVPRE
ncbi:hypothetical protein O6H91_09G051800 [Diphasiastrum complanatum]|uniref:Uncharacterized protein n=1 Tax=Diphasiastrum complanatum TaxID=34168 RepID=A0ACC2CP94_DIPCM|nr:hypothetical protein O6H91_09G051800 [Diphasiastrum complanatum]